MTTSLEPIIAGSMDRAVAGAPVVQISHLSKRFAVRRGSWDNVLHPRSARHVHVLHDVSVDVAPGELFGLLGPNGAGKTTLFKILSTLVTPDQGTASVAGHDLVRDPGGVRQVLTPAIADERSLNWRTSARENLRLYGALQGLRGNALTGRIEEMLATVQLEHTGTEMVAQLSSGMKQRLLIARALLHRPRVLLLDEPTRSLDPISARAFRSFLREEIVGRQGCTVLLATHNPEEALAFCDRVAILNHGYLVTVDSPQSLAHDLMGERYKIWTRTPQHPAFQRMQREGRISALTYVSENLEGTIVEIQVDSTRRDVAGLLSSLVISGVAISRFEQSPFGLADLIERAIQARGGEAN
jgi:ABC-2 type transport system ATP-binding protein